MSYLHLIFGIIVFVVFLITGRFMRVDFPDKEIIPADLRILMRSRHLYILLSSLIHILLGLYLQLQPARWRKILQLSGSVFLVAASILLIWAFVYETYGIQHFSDISRFGLYAALAGTIFHFFGKIWTKAA